MRVPRSRPPACWWETPWFLSANVTSRLAVPHGPQGCVSRPRSHVLIHLKAAYEHHLPADRWLLGSASPSLQPDPKLQTHRFNVPRDSPVRKPGGHSGRDRYKPAPFNPKRLRPQLPKPGQNPLRPSGGSGPSLAIVPGPSARPVPPPVSNPTQKSGRVASGVPWPIV